MAWIQDLLAAKWMLPQEPMMMPPEQMQGSLDEMSMQCKPIFDQSSADEKIAFLSMLLS